MHINVSVSNFFKRIARGRATIPIIVFVILVCALAISLYFTDRPPIVESMSPEIGEPGGILVLRGMHFGEERLNSAVSIAGSRPTASSYLEWTDNRISIQIPQDVGSGMVFVTTRFGKSSELLFTNRDQIPIVLAETSRPGYPRIVAVEPSKGAVGTLITINGLNFGLERGDGRTLFSPVSPAAEIQTVGDSPEKYLPASIIDFDYESWTDQTIKVRVPDGATSGNIRIENDRGQSNALYFEVTDTIGTRIHRQKRGYQIFFSIEISEIEAELPFSIDLWIPGVVGSPEQQNIEYMKIPEPIWDDYLGLSRYQINDLQPDVRYIVNHTYWFDRYEVVTKINVNRINRKYDEERRLFKAYTSEEDLIPSADEAIVNAARSAIRKENNPYYKAKAIYLFLLKNLVYNEKPSGKSIIEDFIAARADPYTYAMLFCSFARSVGVPARPVSGFLVYGKRKARTHFWAEFYLEGFGWIPVDPALGDGVQYEDFPDMESPQDFYFGNMDNQHITFSKGIVQVKPISPQSPAVRKERQYSLQTIHEEPTKSVEGYRSNWSGLQIIDLW